MNGRGYRFEIARSLALQQNRNYLLETLDFVIARMTLVYVLVIIIIVYYYYCYYRHRHHYHHQREQGPLFLTCAFFCDTHAFGVHNMTVCVLPCQNCCRVLCTLLQSVV